MVDEGQIEFEAVCIRATLKAIQVRLLDREALIWVPQSLVHDDSEVYKPGQKGSLIVPEWWALKEGLI